MNNKNNMYSVVQLSFSNSPHGSLRKITSIDTED